MKSDKQTDFERWGKELDYRCESRPAYVYKRKKTLTPEEIAQNNIVLYTQQFKDLKLCANPFCRYPISDSEGFYIGEYGLVCWLCHDMDGALRQTKKGTVYSTIFEWFEAAHNQWKREVEQAKKILKGEDKGGLK